MAQTLPASCLPQIPLFHLVLHFTSDEHEQMQQNAREEEGGVLAGAQPSLGMLIYEPHPAAPSEVGGGGTDSLDDLPSGPS